MKRQFSRMREGKHNGDGSYYYGSASPALLSTRVRLNAEGKQKEKQQRRLNSTCQSDNRYQLWDREEVCQALMKAQRTVPVCFLTQKGKA